MCVCECVCACENACVNACVRVCLWVCVLASMLVCVHASVSGVCACKSVYVHVSLVGKTHKSPYIVDKDRSHIVEDETDNLSCSM